MEKSIWPTGVAQKNMVHFKIWKKKRGVSGLSCFLSIQLRQIGIWLLVSGRKTPGTGQTLTCQYARKREERENKERKKRKDEKKCDESKIFHMKSELFITIRPTVSKKLKKMLFTMTQTLDSDLSSSWIT